MKRFLIFLVLILALAAGAFYWFRHRSAEPKADAAKTEEPEGGARVSRDTNGNVVVAIDDETQGAIGIRVDHPAGARMNPERKGFGRVMDPALFSAAVLDVASAATAAAASNNELVRLKTLAGQGNASARALQTAEVSAQHDQLAFRAAQDKLVTGWGTGLASQRDLPDFAQLLASHQAALVRIDLPAGETFEGQPSGARIVSLSGGSADGDFIGGAPTIDPLTQNRGYYFVHKPNQLQLAPGEAVTGYLKISGQALDGVIIPRDSIVRTEGAAWIYLLNEGAAGFTRAPITLEHPMDSGWFVSGKIATNQYIVVSGAQTLLSEELKGAMKAD